MRHGTRKQEGAARGVGKVRAHQKTRRTAAEQRAPTSNGDSLAAREGVASWGIGRGGRGDYIGASMEGDRPFIAGNRERILPVSCAHDFGWRKKKGGVTVTLLSVLTRGSHLSVAEKK